MKQITLDYETYLEELEEHCAMGEARIANMIFTTILNFYNQREFDLETYMSMKEIEGERFKKVLQLISALKIYETRCS